MKIEYKVDLSKYTTIRIGGIADVFYIPETVTELISILSQDNIMFIGGGSNLLINDTKHYNKVVCLREFCKDMRILKSGFCYIGASVRNQQAIKWINENGMGGIEYLASVPGLIGGAIFMNAGKGTKGNNTIGNLFRQNPIVGIGWRKFYELSTVYGAYNFNLNTHNVYIQLLCETGVLGAIIYFSWFVMLYIKTYKLYKKFRMGSTRDVTRERCLCFSLCLQSFFLLYCLTGNPLYDAPMFIPYFVSCGITLTYERNATISTSTSMDNRKI